jgi:hypothetical protein
MKLALCLVGSFLVCLFLAVAGAGEGASSETGAFWIMGVIGAYWLASAALQVWWWTRGYDRFWRPMVSWGLKL